MFVEVGCVSATAICRWPLSDLITFRGNFWERLARDWKYLCDLVTSLLRDAALLKRKSLH